jgi:hypothetical protein
MGRKQRCNPGETINTAYQKTNILGVQKCAPYKFPIWANNGSCVEDIWQNFKDIVFKSIARFVTHKILEEEKKPDPEYNNKEVKRLKAYRERKLGEHYEAELKRLSKKLLTENTNDQETFLCSVLQNEGKFWSEFYRNVKGGGGEKIGKTFLRLRATDPVKKANDLHN